MQMPVRERVEARRRAEAALSQLAANETTTRSQLGAARDRVNDTHRLADARAVWDAVYGVECIVLEVNGGPREDVTS